MPNEKTDRGGFSTINADQERDNAAKGGSMTSPGNPDNRHGISKPYDEDLQAQIAAKSGKRQKGGKEHKDGAWPEEDKPVK